MAERVTAGGTRRLVWIETRRQLQHRMTAPWLCARSGVNQRTSSDPQ